MKLKHLKLFGANVPIVVMAGFLVIGCGSNINSTKAKIPISSQFKTNELKEVNLKITDEQTKEDLLSSVFKDEYPHLNDEVDLSFDHDHKTLTVVSKVNSRFKGQAVLNFKFKNIDTQIKDYVQNSPLEVEIDQRFNHEEISNSVKNTILSKYSLLNNKVNMELTQSNTLLIEALNGAGFFGKIEIKVIFKMTQTLISLKDVVTLKTIDSSDFNLWQDMAGTKLRFLDTVKNYLDLKMPNLKDKVFYVSDAWDQSAIKVIPLQNSGYKDSVQISWLNQEVPIVSQIAKGKQLVTKLPLNFRAKKMISSNLTGNLIYAYNKENLWAFNGFDYKKVHFDSYIEELFLNPLTERITYIVSEYDKVYANVGLMTQHDQFEPYYPLGKKANKIWVNPKTGLVNYFFNQDEKAIYKFQNEKIIKIFSDKSLDISNINLHLDPISKLMYVSAMKQFWSVNNDEQFKLINFPTYNSYKLWTSPIDGSLKYVTIANYFFRYENETFKLIKEFDFICPGSKFMLHFYPQTDNLKFLVYGETFWSVNNGVFTEFPSLSKKNIIPELSLVTHPQTGELLYVSPNPDEIFKYENKTFVLIHKIPGLNVFYNTPLINPQTGELMYALVDQKIYSFNNDHLIAYDEVILSANHISFNKKVYGFDVNKDNLVPITEFPDSINIIVENKMGKIAFIGTKNGVYDHNKMLIQEYEGLDVTQIYLNHHNQIQYVIAGGCVVGLDESKNWFANQKVESLTIDSIGNIKYAISVTGKVFQVNQNNLLNLPFQNIKHIILDQSNDIKFLVTQNEIYAYEKWTHKWLSIFKSSYKFQAVFEDKALKSIFNLNIYIVKTENI